MFHFPKVVNQIPFHSKQNTQQFCPTAAGLTNNEELILLNKDLQYISVQKIDPLNETHRIFTKSENVESLWYSESNDAILFLERDSNGTKFKLLLNWRKGESKSRHSIILPDNYISPVQWYFPNLNPNELQVLLLANFEKGTSATAQINGNSIIIVSDSVALIWDIYDKPVFRLILIPPFPMKPSLFSFLGDSLALVNNNNLFLLKITNEPQDYDTTPYIPGSECYELEENQLTIDFGVSQENKNFSFLERHLPNHIVSVTTVFRLHLPGEPISIQFISSQTLILVTNNAILSCKRSTNKNGKEIYDPLMIQTSDGVTDILYNENFLILYNKDQIRYIPNPDKSSLDYSYGQLLACDDIKMMNIKFVCANNNYCVIITTSDEGPGVYILKFEKIDVLIKAAIKSSSIDTKMIGLFLMNQSNPLFAENAYKIAMEKLKSKNKKKINEPAEAASLLSYAFNTGKLSQRKRKKALNEINHLNPKIKRNFIEKTNLKKEEITTEMLSEILLIQPSDVAVMKLIQTRQLKCSVNLPESSILDLYKAIRASVENEHENAKLLFLNIPDSTLTLIDDELLTMISKDLTSSTLVRIGKPEFANNEWDINERKASYFFLHERVQEALEIAGKFLDANWHFSDWPKVPKFCGWIEGSEMVKFVAQCITEYSVLENDVPGSIKNIVKGINFAKTKRYKEALETFGDTIFPLRFLRQFAKTSEDWVKVMQQVEENDIKEAAFHFLIANSPRADYYSAVENCSELSAYSSVFRQLKEADEKLIVLIGASLT